MMNLLQRKQHADPTTAELRDQHREVAMRLARGRGEVVNLEVQVEELRMRRAQLRDTDPIHADLPELDLQVQAADLELADLQAQQRFRERSAASLEIAIGIAESREAPALQARRAQQHDELRHGLPEKLRAALVDVEALTQLQGDMQTTHRMYGVTADVLPLGSVLDALRQTLGGSAEELVRYDRDAVIMKEELDATGMGRLVSGAHWLET
jgi:chromosome segregation ATPase